MKKKKPRTLHADLTGKSAHTFGGHPGGSAGARGPTPSFPMEKVKAGKKQPAGKGAPVASDPAKVAGGSPGVDGKRRRKK